MATRAEFPYPARAYFLIDVKYYSILWICMSSFIFNRGQNNKKLFMAGRIASQVRSELERIVQPGKLVIEICEHTQELIHDLGGK